jgi:hypothetical protein
MHVGTELVEQPDRAMRCQTREFGGFRRDCRAPAAWPTEMGVELVVMESMGYYLKSMHAHLKNTSMAAWVANVDMIKHHLSCRKMDLVQSECLSRVLTSSTQDLIIATLDSSKLTDIPY